jgi:preprotein translocase subunit SecF
MDLFKIETKINFMGPRKAFMFMSVLLVAAALALILTRGLNWGIDFTGGLLIEMGYVEAVELDGVRETLAEVGHDNAVVQHFGTASDVLIRLSVTEAETAAADAGDLSPGELSGPILAALQAADPTVEVRRVEFVGAQVGDELTEQGGLAVLFALIGILAYVALRFEYRFAVGSVIALVHDVILTIAFFSLMRIEFDLTVLAAVLAVIGYSLNDTIVIFDRIRENFLSMRKASPVDVVNTSINQTLSRTLMTGVTTLLVLASLFYFGGQVMHGFSQALIVGVIVGTYSSVYIASAAALALGVSKQDLLPPKKEDEDDGRP